MEILLGDPKAAIRSLSGPLVVSMLITSIYNRVDGIWVAGLGADALAGVGFVIPLFLVLIGLGNGLGGGATSAISRYIGEGDKAKADNGAIHSIILTIIISIIVTAMLLLVLDPVLTIMGAAHTLPYAHEYGMIMFLGTILFVLPNAMYGILRAEGDVKRTMYAMILSAILNIILDPILIYILGLGVAGAALATLISTGSVLLVLYYWMFVKKDTYLNPYLSNFKFSRQISLDILGVGIPASLEMIMTATFAAFFSTILAIVAGTDAVAVYSTGWVNRDKAGRISYLKGFKVKYVGENIRKEQQVYSWQTKPQDADKFTDKPQDGNDHCMDAALYVCCTHLRKMGILNEDGEE